MHQISHQSRSESTRFIATNIGYLAMDCISGMGNAHVIGTTSRGIFLKTEDKRIIFISGEPFRGPLTINSSRTGELIRSVSKDMPVQVSTREVAFPDPDLRISLERATVWKAPSPSKPPNPIDDRKRKLGFACEKILERNSTSGLAPLLSNLVESCNRPSQDLSPFQEVFFSFYQKSSSPEQVCFMNFIDPILGAGEGLTPSGDDFVIGFLLALNRWGFVLFPGYDPRKLNSQIVASAYSKTSTLSANLIECAAHGQADERLIEALDWLMSGITPDHSSLEKLLRWGKTSGVDVFVGFVFALSSLENRYLSD